MKRIPDLDTLLVKGTVDPKYIRQKLDIEYENLKKSRNYCNRVFAKLGYNTMTTMQYFDYSMRGSYNDFVNYALKFIDQSWIIVVSIKVNPEFEFNTLRNMHLCESIHSALKLDTKEYVNKGKYVFHSESDSDYVYIKTIYIVKNDHIFDFEDKAYQYNLYLQNIYKTLEQFITTTQCQQPRLDLSRIAAEVLHVGHAASSDQRAESALKAKAITGLGGKPFQGIFPNAPSAKKNLPQRAGNEASDLLEVPF